MHGNNAILRGRFSSATGTTLDASKLVILSPPESPPCAPLILAPIPKAPVTEESQLLLRNEPVIFLIASP